MLLGEKRGERDGGEEEEQIQAVGISRDPRGFSGNAI